MAEKWGVVQRYHDDGTTEAHIIRTDDPPYRKELSKYDEYLNVFDSEEKALQYKLETLEA